MTNDDLLAEKIRTIANHGAKIKYYNDEVGVNSRLDTLQAAILKVKLKYLDQYARARQAAADYYSANLKNIDSIDTPQVAGYSDHVYHQYTIKVKTRRDELKKFLADEGIPSMVYYPVPLHRQKPYKADGDFSVSEELCETVLSLPLHTELKKEDQDYICHKIAEFFN